MGGCRSSLTPTERNAYERMLTSIPVHCQQEIIRLPVKKVFDVYKYHLAAVYYLQRKEYQTAVLSEYVAIKDLELLLPEHKDHVIFIPMHKLLSVCFCEIKNFEVAIKEGQIALDIMLKHTPTDYTEIGLQYFRVAFFSLVGNRWKIAERCFMKAIETSRLSDGLQQDFVQKMEEFLQIAREKIGGSPLRIIPIQYQSNPDESREDLLRRAAAELNAMADQLGTFQIDDNELKRLPDKQTESLINDDILNDVLNNLENYLKDNDSLGKLGAKGGGICFVAAYFKSMQMKTSSLSTAIIEAVLTRIINQINDDDRYARLKQLPFTISYTDDDESNVAGVRMFQVKGNKTFDKQ